MSRESGIPTFRGAREGLWSRFDPTQLATRDAFREDPARVWGWYNYRRGMVRAAQPHAGHRSLVRLESLVPELSIVTQNVDGLHQRAGSADVVELHGNIDRFKCFARDHPVDLDIPVVETTGLLDPPSCPECGSPVRPDVVWYGEPLPAESIGRAGDLARGCDVMLVVGTSGIVYPAAGLPALARSAGATVIEINTTTSELTARAVDLFLQGTAGTVLPALVRKVEGEARGGGPDTPSGQGSDGA